MLKKEYVSPGYFYKENLLNQEILSYNLAEWSLIGYIWSEVGDVVPGVTIQSLL